MKTDHAPLAAHEQAARAYVLHAEHATSNRKTADMDDRCDVAVVGAGISGLATAHALARAGVDVRVFERRAAAGGRIVSERCDGFLMEHGPSAIVSPALPAEALIDELCLAGERIERGERVRHRFLVRDGRLHALPLQPLAFFASPYFTLRERLRLLAEPFVAAMPNDETVAAFAARRFGQGFLDYLVDPLIGGLQAGRPDALSIAATFPQLKRMEREAGSVVRWLARARLRGTAQPAMGPGQRRLFSFRDGLAALPRALAGALGPRLCCATSVERIDTDERGFRLAWAHDAGVAGATRARAVVLALPAYGAARLATALDAKAGAALRDIAHPPLAVVFLGYRAESIRHPLDGLGVLTPALERRSLLGAIFSSTLFEGRAPRGHVAITAFVGGARDPDRTLRAPPELVADVHGELAHLFGACSPPVLSHVRYWPRGLPQPDLGHADRLVALAACEARLPGLFFAGNYLAGASTAACIAGAEATAQRVAAGLSAAPGAGADAPPAARGLARAA